MYLFLFSTVNIIKDDIEFDSKFISNIYEVYNYFFSYIFLI